MAEEKEELVLLITKANNRIEKLKEIILSYLTMSNDFALSSLKTSLKNV